jgi:hypothetical protein
MRDFGLLEPDDIRKAGAEAVKRAISGKRIVEALLAKLEETKISEPREERTSEGASYGVAALDEPSSRAADAAPTAPLAPEATTTAPTAQAPVAEVDLFIDIPARRVRLWGTDIPIRPPRNLQPQLFYALAALALHANDVVSMADLADGIRKLGRLPRKPIAPDARDLRYRILRALRPHVTTHPGKDGFDRLLENVSGFGLRLNCTAQVLRVRDDLVARIRPTTAKQTIKEICE